MSCTFTEKISSLIDGELATAEAREVERHLLTCGECEQVKADFLSLRSQIASFETSVQPAVSNRALQQILSPPDRDVRVRERRWGWSTPAIAFATLLIVGAIIGFVLYQSSNRQDRESQIAGKQTPAPAPSATVEKPKSEPSPGPSREPEQPAPNKDNKETTSPRRTPPAPSKKPLVREPRPGEQFAAVTTPAPTPEHVRSADSETLTAIHFEKSETLLRAFRNVRLDTRGFTAEVAYERKRAQELVYQNMILRRQADANGDVQIASLLENLEPILLDIANLPEKPNKSAVRTIRDRVERKNIVVLLQVNSMALARALD
jgi:hypothetical protein